jgi:hypothetical protein
MSTSTINCTLVTPPPPQKKSNGIKCGDLGCWNFSFKVVRTRCWRRVGHHLLEGLHLPFLPVVEKWCCWAYQGKQYSIGSLRKKDTENIMLISATLRDVNMQNFSWTQILSACHNFHLFLSTTYHSYKNITMKHHILWAFCILILNQQCITHSCYYIITSILL